MTSTSTTPHTASEAHGTGAATMIHGIGTHGPTPLGDTTAGMIRSMWEAGMTLGIMADGAGTTGTATIIIRTTAAGTEAGTLTTAMDIYMVRDTSMTNRADRDITDISEDRDIRRVPTEYSRAGLRSEAVQV